MNGFGKYLEDLGTIVGYNEQKGNKNLRSPGCQPPGHWGVRLAILGFGFPLYGSGAGCKDFGDLSGLNLPKKGSGLQCWNLRLAPVIQKFHSRKNRRLGRDLGVSTLGSSKGVSGSDLAIDILHR